MRDGSIDTVFHGRAEHIPVEQPPTIRVAKQVEAESVDSSKAKVDDLGDAMVVHHNMTANRFLPNEQPMVQQVPPSLP